MNFITILRKLNILRFGVKKYKYTSGRDMPAQAILDDVYDTEKDLVNKEVKEFTSYVKKKVTGKKSACFCVKCGQQIPLDDSFCTKCGTAVSD